MVKRLFLVLIFSILGGPAAWAQCQALSTNFSLIFKTDRECAPVEVTEFSVTYNFNTPQVPGDIQIVYQWNDPLNSVTSVELGTGLIVSPDNRSFTANATKVYTDHNGLCTIQPTAMLFINGVACPSSMQAQIAPFWGTDRQANGDVAIQPEEWDVCHGNAVVDAQFSDASEFNCNRQAFPDAPNEAERHVQFVYGTNHNGANSIRNLSLTDGGQIPLTNGTGTLASSETRGTADMLVEAAYFGPVEVVPYPATGPNASTFLMNAPADAANLVGSRFEVTLFNWNVCNPWNGDPINPNYEDAEQTQAYIVIVEAPQPQFMTRDEFGNAETNFCIGETIHFVNQTPNVSNYDYTWEFFDDDTPTNRIHTSSSRNPSFSFPSGGRKLIRLTARNNTVQGTCMESVEGYVNITPSLAAEIAVTDLNNVAITPDFCQEHEGTLTNFDVRFADVSTGSVTSTTRWRWEFYDQHDNLVRREPASGYSASVLGPFDEVFTDPGVYRVRLLIRDELTGCESMDEVQVRVFEKPQPAFTFTRVCEGVPVTFTDESMVDPIAGETIVSWEWDMNYDGVTFDRDPALDNRQTFDYTFPGPGQYSVALRVTTDGGTCTSMVAETVTIDPHPDAQFTPDITEGCSLLTVTFTNDAAGGQPDDIDAYIWEIDEGSGFEVDSIQRPHEPGFEDHYVRYFRNAGLADREFRMRLRVVTVNGCEALSSPETITVYPQPRAGFVSLNYSPFDDNCTPVSVDFRVDDDTHSLNPTDYTWKVTDADGIVAEISTGTTPSFSYDFDNTTQSVRDFFVTLRATLPSSCYGDSTRTIRVAPVPRSEFATDTVTYACDRVLLELDAAQKGLSQYNWNIDINGVVVYNNTTEDEVLQYEVTRSSTIDQVVTLSLRTKNLANCESTVSTRSLIVKKTDTMTPSFRAEPSELTLPETTVALVNETSPGPWSYHWDFGDGTSSADPDVGTHTYDTFGEYTITLTVENGDCVQTFSRVVKINPIPPVLAFDYFPPRGCAPLTVSFINESRYADPTTYFWKFGTGQGTSRATDPTYVYQEPGVYSVTLSATNLLGDTVSLTREMIIEVLPNPVAKFSVYPTTPLNVPGEILYTSNRSLNASEYFWDFGDGNTSTEIEPQHKYSEEGIYSVTLIARNGDGCADTTVLESGIQAINHGQMLIPNAFIPNATGPGSGNVLNNEVFLPIVQKVTRFQMLIFNRWGQLLFESNSPDVGWDGYYNGMLCAQDVYIYRIDAEYENGRQITRTGDVTLLR